MKYYLTIICYSLLLGCSRQLTPASAQETSLLQQHWIHSYEENGRQDTAAYQTYRPAGYRFPPARGRAGFEIKPGGIFIDHPIAPADGNLTLTKKWTLDKDQLVITGDGQSQHFRIKSLTKEKLVLEEVSSQ